FSASVPGNIAGDWYVFVVTDAHGQIYEFNREDNNLDYDRRRRVRIRATPPDLTVQSVSAPGAAVAGNTLSVTWTVRNQGAFDAGPAFRDVLYLSTDNQLDVSRDIPLSLSPRNILPAGQSYTVTQTATLPTCLSGVHYLFVVTDQGNALFEYDSNFDAEQNNVSAPRAITLNALPPDLRVDAVNNPATAVAGQPVQISWTVTNHGTGPVSAGAWADTLYLGENSVPDPARAQVLGTFQRLAPLAENASYTQAQTVLLPRRTQGTYYVFVATNTPVTVPECTGLMNNVTAGANPLEISNTLPDLSLSSVSAPPTAVAGQRVTVNWQAVNGGRAAVTGTPWHDGVYLSVDQRFDDRDTLLVAQPANRGALAVNETYTSRAEIKIPNVSPGQYYLLVRADANDTIYEGRAEGNNLALTAIQLANPLVDLAAGNVVIPATAFSSQGMTVTWTVTNRGQQPTSENTWTDDVILSRDPIYDVADRVIGFLPHEGVLDGGASYSASLDVSVPREASGEYYVLVRADRHNTVPEQDNNNNAAASPGRVRITLAEPAELSLTSVSAPASGAPGEPATIGWTVRNSGRNPARGRWTDAVYLSRDNIWDIGDALVGRVPRDTELAVGASYSATLENTLPALEPGEYFVIVRADAQNTVREENENNNTTTSTTRTTVDIITLVLGTPRNDLFTRTGQQRHYKVEAPGNETLLYTLTGQNPAAFNELYVRAGQTASLSAADFRFPNKYSPNQEITVPKTSAGTYYSLTRAEYVPPAGNGAAGSDPYTIKAEILPFGTRAVVPATAGNNGFVTLELHGSKYQEGAKVRLVRNGVTLTPKYVGVTFSRIRAFFDLQRVAPGDYDVMVENPDGQTHLLPRGFQVIAGGGPVLDVDVVGPETILSNRATTFTVSVANRGNDDSLMTVVFLAMPKEVRWRFAPGQEPISDIEGLTKAESDGLTSIEYEGMRFIPLVVPVIQVGRAFTISLELTSGPGEIYLNAVAMDNFSLLNPAPATPVASGVAIRRSSSGQLVSESVVVECSATIFGLIAKMVAEKVFGNSCPGAILGFIFGDASERMVQQYILNQGGLDPKPSSLLKLVVDVAKVALTCAVDLAAKSNPYLLALQIAKALAETIALGMDLKEIDEDCFEKSRSQKKIQVVTPRDPNDKIGPGGYGAPGWVAGSALLPYTINFENVPTATAAAQRVRITDQLDRNLDWRTFRLREISFGKNRISVPENRAFFQTRVELGEDLGRQLADISAGIDIASGEVSWTLTMIDPQTGEQPTSPALGLLAPNDATGRGQGFVSFTIQAREGLSTSAQISNKAVIVFDTEEAIATNTVGNTLDNDTPESAIAALPANSDVTLTLTWAGADRDESSGLASFDIYMSRDDGPYQLLQGATTETSMLFTGVAGSSHRFYSRARDHAGNVEAAPDTPDAITRIGAAVNPQPALTSLDPGAVTAGNPAITLTINGTGFVNGSEARWNGAARTTAFVSATQLRAQIPATDLASPGTATITVVNPAPVGGTSNPLNFIIQPAASTLTINAV
ncbi:MAG: CARDB domain-containing protein, partial [Blastocatellia bacterium]